MEIRNPVILSLARFTAKVFMLIAALALLAWANTSPAWAVTQYEYQKLLGSDAAEGDRLGGSVAMDGNTAVVGGWGDGFNGFSSGSAYVFTRSPAGAWTEQQKLTPSDVATHNLGFWSVAVDEDTAVIGARGDDDNGFRSGSAYVFTRSTAGVWTEQQKLTASNAAERHNFGAAVAVDGDTAVIVATGVNLAYVFERSAEGVWYEQYVLTASGAAFGSSVTLHEDTALIGTFGGWDVWGDRQYAAYVFTRGAGGGWAEQQMLFVTDYGPYDGTPFTVSVALDGNTAVIGSCFPHYSNLGVAYVFTRVAGGYWIEQQKLTTSDSEAGNEFGCSVAVNEDTALVGDPSYDDATGSAYLFTRSVGGVWTERQKLIASDGGDYQWFASSVAMDEHIALIGAWGDDDNGFNSGAAYIYRIEASETERALLIVRTDGKIGDGSPCPVPRSRNSYSTIQAAVYCAHDGDRIRVARGIFVGGASIDKYVTIVGQGPTKTVLTGGFDIRATVNLKHVTISSPVGAGPAVNGGLLETLAAGKRLVVENCWLVNGHAGDGGAIKINYDTEVVIKNSVLSANGAAGIGGAITNNGTLRISDSIITGNTAAFGAGIYNRGILFITSATVITGNHSDTDGGGVFNEGGTVTLWNKPKIFNNTPIDCVGCP